MNAKRIGGVILLIGGITMIIAGQIKDKWKMANSGVVMVLCAMGLIES